MSGEILTAERLAADLRALGVAEGDGLFVHASMRAIGPVIGGARAVVAALFEAVGPEGLLGMPGFSTDASFPAHLDRAALTPGEVAEVERAVPGHDPALSSCAGMGAIAECFRTWPGTCRSPHPTSSVCLNGEGAAALTGTHGLAWANGPETPLGRLADRAGTKLLLLGVGWNRCSALHTAETLASHRRTKVRRFKTGAGAAAWRETPDVADDLDRLFPRVGAAAEAEGLVRQGPVGAATARLGDFGALVRFAAAWIGAENARSGARH